MTILFYLNFLKGVGDHGNKHVEQDNDDDEREDAVQHPSDKLRQRKLWHVHIILVGHAEHGPKEEVERLIKPAAEDGDTAVRPFCTLYCISLFSSDSIVSPAKMWRDGIRNIDIVEATEEGRSNDHQYKHKSKKKNHLLQYVLILIHSKVIVIQAR